MIGLHLTNQSDRHRLLQRSQQQRARFVGRLYMAGKIAAFREETVQCQSPFLAGLPGARDQELPGGLQEIEGGVVPESRFRS
ncbi:hypothetical protein D3C73_1306240 [compost metagenome]